MNSSWTRTIILNGFVGMLNEMDFKSITITSLAQRLNINRNTIYYHFKDVYDILETLFSMELEKIYSMADDSLSWDENFLKATEFARKNKRAIYHIYNSVSTDLVNHYLYLLAGDVVSRIVEKSPHANNACEKDKRYLVLFYQSAMSDLMLRWIMNRMQEEPAELLKSLKFLLEGSIDRSLERSSKKLGK